MADKFEVEYIKSHRINPKGEEEYYVKWVGYPMSQSTWEPLKHLTSCMDMIKKYKLAQSNKPKTQTEVKSSNKAIRSNPVIRQSARRDSPQPIQQIDQEPEEVQETEQQQKEGMQEEEADNDEEFKVIAMGRDGDDVYFKVIQDGNQSVLPRKDLINNNLRAMIEFYHESLSFIGPK